jgi:transposase-like protein
LHNNGRRFFAWDKSNWHNTVLPVYKKTGSSYAAAKAVGVNSTTVYRWLSNNGHLVRKYRERDISSFKFQNYR